MSSRIAVCLLLAPGVARAGILVDHPTLRIAPGPAQVVHAASVTVSAVDLEDCAGNATVVAIAEEVDLLGGTGLPLPPGEWCAVSARTPGGVHLEVGSDGAQTTLVEVPATRLELLAVGEGPVAIGNGPLVFELAAPSGIDAAMVERHLVDVGAGNAFDSDLTHALERGRVANTW